MTHTERRKRRGFIFILREGERERTGDDARELVERLFNAGRRKRNRSQFHGDLLPSESVVIPTIVRPFFRFVCLSRGTRRNEIRRSVSSLEESYEAPPGRNSEDPPGKRTANCETPYGSA